MLVIVLLPLFGGLFYLFWGNTPLNRARTQHQYEPKPPDFTDYMRTPATKELIERPSASCSTRPLYRDAGRYAGVDQHGDKIFPYR